MIKIINVLSILGIYYVFRKIVFTLLSSGLFSIINDLKKISEHLLYKELL